MILRISKSPSKFLSLPKRVEFQASDVELLNEAICYIISYAPSHCHRELKNGRIFLQFSSLWQEDRITGRMDIYNLMSTPSDTVKIKDFVKNLRDRVYIQIPVDDSDTMRGRAQTAREKKLMRRERRKKLVKKR